ncbi:MAG TPA: SLC13 family permease [Longimicrobiales bacterium]
MSWEAWFTLAVVLGALYALARDLYSPALTILTATIVLLTVGIITPAQAFSGFSNAAPITVAALYVLASAVEKTGALQPLLRMTVGGAGGPTSKLARLLFPTAAASAFLNNTPIVATLAPQVASWAERKGESPSRYLMPLSFATILGGVVTLIGTSTNIVVSGLLEETGRPGIGMFEITPMGLPVAVAGIAFLALFSHRMLPERKGAAQLAREHVREFVVNMEVVRGGALDGATVEQAGLRNLAGVYLIEVDRDGTATAPVAPDFLLEGGDRLTFAGRADLVVDLQRSRGLVSSEQPHLMEFDQPGHTFFEAVIGEASPLVGRTLKEVDFRSRYQAAVVAVHRSGKRLETKLGAAELKVGDTLLLLTDAGFGKRWRDRNDFLLVSRFGGTPPTASRKAWLVGLITAFIVVCAGTGVVPVLQASLVGAMLLIAFRILSPGEARAAVDLDVIIVIAASFGIGAAMEQTGLAATVATGMSGLFDGFGAMGVLFGIVLTTIAVTELITNNAAAVLVFPIAMSSAETVGGDPRVFAIAVAVSASASFLTPIGYQTNTMVYGMGGYRFGDYARLGFPLTIAVVAAIMLSAMFLY